MAAQVAYRQSAYSKTAPAKEFAQSNAPRLRAERGSAAEQSVTPFLVTFARMVAVVLVVISVLAFVRIALTNETVVTLMQRDSVQSELNTARSSGVGLEMEQSVLSNASAMKAASKRLGMIEPAEVGVVSLPPDTIGINDDGSLSLSKTVNNIASLKG